MEKYKKYKNIMATHPRNIDFIDDVYAVTYDIQGHDAFTLDADDIGVHEDGWAINGKVWEDYFTWVNEFEAIKNGKRVWGDFEKVVYCTSLEALEDFLENHKPDTWDYWDI